jgi:TRAP transporter TAXI family solute receptor
VVEYCAFDAQDALARDMIMREFLRANWHVVTIVTTASAIFCAALLLLNTMPPRAVVMATGSAGGEYQEIGKQYRAALMDSGEDLRLVTTAGSMENLALLRDPHSHVDIALIQSGTIKGGAEPELESLGALFYEPLWIFHRSELQDLTLENMHGRRVSIGPAGSGTSALSLELLKRNGLNQQVGELLALEPQAAADQLLAGQIDVAFIIASWDAPVVQRLIADERVSLTDIHRADAYVALYPFLSKVTVPAGVGNLVKHLPPSNVTLLAATASLAVRKTLHPAIQYLLLNTGSQIHSGVGIFQRAGHFPAAEGIDLPLSEVAVQFYKSGQPFLQNVLPFWAASLMGRLLILLIPIIGVLYPTLRLLPALYNWLMRSKISRLYGELKFLENEIAVSGSGVDTNGLTARLNKLEKEANALKVPIAYVTMMYLLREQVTIVRDRLRAR